MSAITKTLVEQAGIQGGLAFFYTLGGSGVANAIGLDPVSITRSLVVAGVAAGLAVFVKLSIGTGGSMTPISGAL